MGIEENPGYPNQRMYILNIEDYAVVVPFVESEEEIFLKTAFPSRKFTSRYGLKDTNPVSNLAEEKEKAVQAARNTLNNTEYQFDYSKAKPNRFVGQQQEPILVALEPDVAAVFGTAEAVNRALRALIERISPALPDAI